MTALSSFGSVQIFIDEETTTREVYRAELRPLNAIVNTTQYFGAGSLKHQVRGLVITEADKLQLESWAVNNTAQTFTNDQGSQGSFKINGTVKSERIKFAGAVIDGTAYTASTAIYRCEIELIAI